MSTEQEQSPTSTPVAKPLLLEALGKPFLAYVLAATEDEIDQWLTGEADQFGSERQAHALRQLWILLQVIPADDHPELRRLNLSRILGTYQEPFHTTLVNSVRMIATGAAATPPANESLVDILRSLAGDAYPLYLLPETSEPIGSMSPSLYQHPLREQFEAAVMADETLSRLFPDENPHSGRTGSVLRSSGQGGGVQLWGFAELLVSAGWRLARLKSTTTPSLDEHIQATLGQLDVIRTCIVGGEAEVPVRVGFTGALLPAGTRLDLGWGTLRPIEDRDRHLVPQSIVGGLSGTGEDGTSVTIDYSGDIVLETTLPYRIELKELQLSVSVEWPKSLRAYERVQRLVESVQLGALLSQEIVNNEPITMVPTWRVIHDPLAHMDSVGWSDARANRSFMPRQLNDEQAAGWRDLAVTIERERTKNIDVAIRRALRAASERRDYVDVLVDSVIAWENLVGSQKGEPTLRVSGALAWLLEDDVDKRIERRSELSKLYGLRSAVVHGNQPPDGQEIVPKSQRALELTIEALRILFTRRLELLKGCRNSDDRSNRLLMGG